MLTPKQRKEIYLKAAEIIGNYMNVEHNFVCNILERLVMETRKDITWYHIKYSGFFPEFFSFKDNTNNAWLTQPEFWGYKDSGGKFTPEGVIEMNNGKILILCMCAEMTKDSEE